MTNLHPRINPVVTASKKKSHAVVDALLAHFKSGSWKPGDRLPSERELCEEFQVSRTIIREALSALQLAGYVDARAGAGTYVLQPPRNEPRSTKSLVQAGLSIVEALEAREAMDISAAHLAIENADDRDLERLSQLVGELETTVAQEDYRRYIDLTLDFHIVLAEAGGNRFIEQSVATLIDRVRPSLWVLEYNYNREVGQHSLEIHRRIYQAVKDRDLDKAIQAVRLHYENYPAFGQRPLRPMSQA